MGKNENPKSIRNLDSFEKKTLKLTKKDRTAFILEGKTHITRLGNKLEAHTQRNRNTNHINYKIFHLLRDPFIFINAYTKISKNKGALTKGFKDSNTMKYFGLKQAKLLAQKVSREEYKFSPVKRTWKKKTKDRWTFPHNLTELFKKPLEGF